jgi:ELWxxDGT repeat protein
MTMRPIILRLSWPLVCFISTCIAIPLGYAVVWITTVVVSMILVFLWVVGAFIGLVIGAAFGGALVGWISGQAQQSMLGEFQPPAQRVRAISSIIWAFGGMICLQAYLPVVSGDMAPLVPILLTCAVLASGAQWLVLAVHRVPGSFWWGSGGMLGITSGTLAGVLVLGAIHGRIPTEVLPGLSSSYESIDTVRATYLLEFNHRIALFIAIGDINRPKQWELWTSDGTPQGTVRIKTGYTGWNEARPYTFTVKANQLFFTAYGTEDQADSQSYKNDLKAWVTDGTPAGSQPWLSPVPEGTAPHVSTFSLEPPQLSDGSATYFVIQKNTRSIELWWRDNASGQEMRLKTLP